MLAHTGWDRRPIHVEGIRGARSQRQPSERLNYAAGVAHRQPPSRCEAAGSVLVPKLDTNVASIEVAFVVQADVQLIVEVEEHRAVSRTIEVVVDKNVRAYPRPGPISRVDLVFGFH